MPKIMSVGNVGGGQTQSRTVYLTDGLSPTLCSSMGDKGNTMPYIVEVKKMNVKEIGRMDHTLDNTFESANRVYDTDGLSPTINTCGGGGLQPKIVDVEKIIVDDLYDNREKRLYTVTSPTIRSERIGLKVLETEELSKLVDVANTEGVAAIDEQNKRIRKDTFGTLTTDGSSPKHNNRVLEIEQVKK